MKNLLINANNTQERIGKKIYNLKAEKLVREANDNFIYFKDYEMALTQVEEVLNLDPENVKAFILKGNIFFCLNEIKTALDCFEKALEIDPYSVEAHSSKANILDIHGELKEALKSCKKAFCSVTNRDKEILTCLYDQKIAILIKLKKYDEAKQVLKQSYKHLKEEDCSYIASCYRDVIDNLQKKRKEKKNMAIQRLKLVYSL